MPPPDDESALPMLAHLYRGELGRSDRWRTRLDATTHWAVTTLAVLLSFAFVNPAVPPGTLIVGVWLVIAYLFIEARRYRYYDLWIHRVRLMEAGLWAAVLRQEPIDKDSLKELAAELARPQLRISLGKALRTRLRETYGPILAVALATWFVKIHAPLGEPLALREAILRARLGAIPGAVVFSGMCLLSAAFIALYVAAWLMPQPVGELKPRPGLRNLPSFFSKAPRRLVDRPS